MLKEYPEYKESGIDWIRKIPKYWKTLMLFQCAEEYFKSNKNVHHQNLLSLSYGKIKRKDINTKEGLLPASFDDYQVVKKGNIILRLTDLQNDHKSLRTGLVNETGIITSAYVCIKPRDNVTPEYLHWILHTCDSHKVFYGMGGGVRQSIGYTDISKMYFPIPPISEQNAIVKYLDYKTKQIDEFVSAKEKEIESLQELKKSLVADAVTKGISGEELVDSGIEWLPKVPKGWTVHTLRHLLKAFSEKNHSEMQLLSVTRELGVIVRDVEDTESNHNFIPDDLSNYKMVKKGQFVINKMKAWQGSYGVSDFDGIVSPAYFIFDLNFEDKDFFHLAIRSRKYADFFARYSDGIRSGQWDLSMLDMKNIPFFVPPKEEQKKIVKYCKDKVRNINILISSIQKQITLVKELRTKLIADAVTGKIDVREAV